MKKLQKMEYKVQVGKEGSGNERWVTGIVEVNTSIYIESYESDILKALKKKHPDLIQIYHLGPNMLE